MFTRYLLIASFASFIAGVVIPPGIRSALASDDAAVVIDASVTPVSVGAVDVVPGPAPAPAPRAAVICPQGVPMAVAQDGTVTCGIVAVPTDPLADLGLLEKLYRSGAFVDVGILLVFFGLTFASGRLSVLQHYAAYVSAALGGLALLVVPASLGETPNASMLATAGVVAVALVIDPKLGAKLAATFTAKQS